MAATTQAVTEELRRWILAQAEAGYRPADVIESMKASGWDEEVAVVAIERTLHQQFEALDREPEVLPPASPVPEPALLGGPTLVLTDGHEVRVLATLRHPRVVVFGGLLSDAECQGLMDLAAPRLLRSETVDRATGGSEVNAARTSEGMFFERGEAPLINTIERRIAELVRWPLDHGEGLQVLRYGPGAEYRAHQDYFDPQHAGTARILQRGGQRVGTVVMYLRTPLGGGATTFPDAGLDVAPLRGNAVFFSYERPHASTHTLHGSAPVTAGEKWVATKWLRQGVFV